MLQVNTAGDIDNINSDTVKDIDVDNVSLISCRSNSSGNSRCSLAEGEYRSPPIITSRVEFKNLLSLLLESIDGNQFNSGNPARVKIPYYVGIEPLMIKLKKYWRKRLLILHVYYIFIIFLLYILHVYPKK